MRDFHETAQTLRGCSITLVNGCFRLLHIGHIRLFKEASRVDIGSLLVVALNTDDYVRAKTGQEPVFSLQERGEFLESIRVVDAVTWFEGDNCSEVIRTLKPKTVVKGDDYSLENINPEELAAMEEVGARLHFVKRNGHSSSETIKFIQNQAEVSG